MAGGYCFAEAFGYALAIRLSVHNHTPESLSTCLPFHQQAANQLRGNRLGGATEEGVGGRLWDGVMAMGVDL